MYMLHDYIIYSTSLCVFDYSAYVYIELLYSHFLPCGWVPLLFLYSGLKATIHVFL